MMFNFKSLLAFAAVAASATTANAATIERRGTASCTFIVTPQSPVPPTNLSMEFNFLLGYKLSQHVGAIYNHGSTVTPPPPPATAPYTVDITLSAASLTDPALSAHIASWQGETLFGDWSGVNWELTTVTC